VFLDEDESEEEKEEQKNDEEDEVPRSFLLVFTISWNLTFLY